MNFLKQTLFTINNEAITGTVLLYELLIPILVIVLISLLVYFLLRYLLKLIYLQPKNILEDQQKKIELANTYKRTTHRIRKYLYIITLIELVVATLLFLEKTALIETKQFLFIFTKPIYTAGKTELSLTSIMLIVVLALVSYYFSRIIVRIAKKVVREMPTENSKRYLPLTQIVGHVSLLLIFIVGLSFIGIDISSFAVILGVLGVGIGFGLQDIVANFFSGLVIGFSRIITEGDRVYIQGVEGDVQQINLLNTVVRSLTQEELIIPNKFIINEAIQNYSHTDSKVYASATVQVDYNSDMHRVKEVVIQAASDLPWTKKGATPVFRMKSFDDSGITIGVFVLLEDVRNKYQAQSDLNMLIWERFRHAQINIPFPQREIRIKTEKVTQDFLKEQNASQFAQPYQDDLLSSTIDSPSEVDGE